MVTSVLDETGKEAGADGKPPLSEKSEREILEMVEDQLDRPNPPDTGVLYRRAMHFIDRDVRHLSLQQFNAKFPLQVKRRKARDREARNGGSPDGSGAPAGSDDRREVVREALLDFAKAVAGADDRGDVIDVVTGVDEYVDRVVEEM